MKDGDRIVITMTSSSFRRCSGNQQSQMAKALFGMIRRVLEQHLQPNEWKEAAAESDDNTEISIG